MNSFINIELRNLDENSGWQGLFYKKSGRRFTALGTVAVKHYHENTLIGVVLQVDNEWQLLDARENEPKVLAYGFAEHSSVARSSCDTAALPFLSQ